MPVVHSPLAATLRRVPLFADLSESELAEIGDHAAESAWEPGQIVFSEGDACHELWIVKEGAVKLLKLAPNGRQQLLAVERAGSSLAEVPIFDGGRYPATAQAERRAVLLRVDAVAFRAVCTRRPELALKVIKVLGRRLRLMGALIEEPSFSTVRARLIGRLLQLAAEQGRETARGLEFPLAENNEELAARLGTVRELVSRNLGRLHNEGLIDIRRRSVTIPDLARLKDEMQM
jgi:CRP-like cAMP-binding protein